MRGVSRGPDIGTEPQILLHGWDNIVFFFRVATMNLLEQDQLDVKCHFIFHLLFHLLQIHISFPITSFAILLPLICDHANGLSPGPIWHLKGVGMSGNAGSGVGFDPVGDVNQKASISLFVVSTTPMSSVRWFSILFGTFVTFYGPRINPNGLGNVLLGHVSVKQVKHPLTFCLLGSHFLLDWNFTKTFLLVRTRQNLAYFQKFWQGVQKPGENLKICDRTFLPLDPVDVCW